MSKIKVDLLEEGMVVAADVKNMDDMLLLPEGCVLSEKQIHILQAWGISEIQIQGQDDAGGGTAAAIDLDSPQAQQAAADMRERFWHFNAAEPIQQEVFRLMCQRKLQPKSSPRPGGTC